MALLFQASVQPGAFGPRFATSLYIKSNFP